MYCGTTAQDIFANAPAGTYDRCSRACKCLAGRKEHKLPPEPDTDATLGQTIALGQAAAAAAALA